LQDVSIIVDTQQRMVGRTHCRPRLQHLAPDTHWAPISTAEAQQLRAAIMISFAGVLAEARFTGRFTWRCADADREIAMEFARYVEHTPATFRAYLDALFRQTEELVNAPRVWPLIEAVAEKLLCRGHLEPEEVRRIVAQGSSGVPKANAAL
jgi:hypothetical protein